MHKLIVILGTNASGKSDVGLKLAKEYNGEIISADSRQIFRGFDLCSGKVTADEMAEIPHHMIDIRTIGETFSVADFQELSYKLIPEIVARGKIPMIVGGTGLYVDSVTQGYILANSKPNYVLREKYEAMTLEDLRFELDKLGISHRKEDHAYFLNKRRIIRLIEKAISGEPLETQRKPRFASLQLGVTWPKEILHKRIEERLSIRIKQGMINEVKTYIENGGDANYLYNLGLEYRYIYWYLSGKYNSLDEFFEEMSRAIKRFAKKQLTWFRRNKDIIWLDMESDYMTQAEKEINMFLNNQ